MLLTASANNSSNQLHELLTTHLDDHSSSSESMKSCQTNSSSDEWNARGKRHNPLINVVDDGDVDEEEAGYCHILSDNPRLMLGKQRSNSCVLCYPFQETLHTIESGTTCASNQHSLDSYKSQKRRRSCYAALEDHNTPGRAETQSESKEEAPSIPNHLHPYFIKWKLHRLPSHPYSMDSGVQNLRGVSLYSRTGDDTAHSSSFASSPCTSASSSTAVQKAGISEDGHLENGSTQHDLTLVETASTSSHDSCTNDNTNDLSIHQVDCCTRTNSTKSFFNDQVVYDTWLQTLLLTFFPREMRLEDCDDHLMTEGHTFAPLSIQETLIPPRFANPFLMNDNNLKGRFDFLLNTWPLLFTLYLCENKDISIHLPGTSSTSLLECVWNVNVRGGDLKLFHQALITVIDVMRKANLPLHVYKILRYLLPMLARSEGKRMDGQNKLLNELLMNSNTGHHWETRSALDYLMTLNIESLGKLYNPSLLKHLDAFLRAMEHRWISKPPQTLDSQWRRCCIAK